MRARLQALRQSEYLVEEAPMRTLASILVAVVAVAYLLQPACALQCSFSNLPSPKTTNHVPHCGDATAGNRTGFPGSQQKRDCGHDGHPSAVGAPVLSGVSFVSPVTVPLFVDYEEAAAQDSTAFSAVAWTGKRHAPLFDPGLASPPLRV